VALTTPGEKSATTHVPGLGRLAGGPTPPATKPLVPEAAAQKDTSIIEKRRGGGKSTQDGR
jgi:hypothetical protein